MSPDGSITVLLVDDEILVRSVARLALQRRGHSVLEAQGGSDGLRCFTKHRHKIDLVVTDVTMPDMTGTAMIEEIRREHLHVRVLFISGRDEALPEWANDTCGLLLKPFTPSQLVTAVDECLGLASR